MHAVVLHEVEQGHAAILLHADELVEGLGRVHRSRAGRDLEAPRALAPHLDEIAAARGRPHEAGRRPHDVLQRGLQAGARAMSAVEVDEEREPGNEVHLVLLHRGRAAAGGGRPVDPPEIVAGPKVAHPRQARLGGAPR